MLYLNQLYDYVEALCAWFLDHIMNKPFSEAEFQRKFDGGRCVVGA